MSEENTVPQITIQDLVLAANIIDLASQRGAFKAAEATQVGACFEKIVAFVKANQPQPEPTAGPEA
jgi:hypothetical protein